MLRKRWLVALAAVATVFVYAAADHADARAGRSSSMGSRGNNTYSAPPPTATAPSAASPIQRSATAPAAAPRPGMAANAARPGLFGGGLLGGLAAGFIGAGLFGMLFGHGFMGGMGGFASFLGLIAQIALVVIVAKLALTWWRNRNGASPAYAGPASRMNMDAGAQTSAFTGGFGSMFGGGGNAAPAQQPLSVEKDDYDAFERLLDGVQKAYSAEDLNALRLVATPEMVGYFSEELSENASRGVVNKVEGVKLVSGDLSEAWREGDAEYATVAMRYALTDSVIDRASGRTVEGGQPDEVTEVWTFRRSRGGHWLLSAIQQA